MLYNHKGGALPQLTQLPGLTIDECDDPHLLSELGSISLIEAMRRLAEDNKAYVAWYNGKAAAFGWMACKKAHIGELNHEIILPVHHRYLWNFRTLVEFRGLGIYPLLLQYILKRDTRSQHTFWIMHAPENHASQKGITKAGFRLTGNVAVAPEERVSFKSAGMLDRQVAEVIETLGFFYSDEEQAPCWMCNSPYLAHKWQSCCCLQDSVDVCNVAGSGEASAFRGAAQ